jgi:hypothetical protein
VRALIYLLAILAMAVPASSQTTLRALVPIGVGEEIPGVFGSRWMAFLNLYNMGTTNVRSCTGGIATRPEYAPGTTTHYPAPKESLGQGAFICIQGSPDDVVLNLRIQDLSRQALTWGTEIPVVYEKDVRTQSLALVNVPTDERFRQTLRIYDWDGNRGEAFRLRIRNRQGIVLTDEVLTPIPAPDPLFQPHLPGYTEVSWLAGTYPQIMTEEQVTLEISPVNPAVRFWAFVSVTNNETQHVTTVTPN